MGEYVLLLLLLDTFDVAAAWCISLWHIIMIAGERRRGARKEKEG